MTVRRILLPIALALVFAAGGARSAEAQVVQFSCTPGPADCTGWRTTDVVLRWFPSPAVQDSDNCPIAETLTAEGIATWLCGVQVGGTWTWVPATISIDKSVPVVAGGTPTRAPDGDGWYRAPVDVAFSGSDAISGLRSCTVATYSRPDSASAAVSGTCTDVAGNTSVAASFPLRYDATGPDVTRGRPVRKPDHGRWYTRPVRWRFKGKDALSGIAECPTVLYRGPDGALARVIGGCRDKAGNVALRSFAIRYDATPPPRPSVRALPRDGAVRLKIAAPEARSIAILRSPGRGGTEDSTIYRGGPKSFTDFSAVNGKRYRYTVSARDRAANRSRRTISATPGPRLLVPADGAVLTAPPLLRWTPVHGASYYNVQLYRDGRKILSRWPVRPRFQLTVSWRWHRNDHALVPGRYEWDVWPGFGARDDARYGSRIGSRDFVIPGAPPAR